MATPYTARAEAGGAPEISEVKITIRRATIADNERIGAYVDSMPNSVIFQHPSWVKALSAESGGTCFTLVCEDGEGSLRGVLPLLSTRGLPFKVGRHNVRRRISSLPRTPIASVLADTDEIGTALVNAAKSYAQEQRADLEVKTWTTLPVGAEAGLKRATWRPTYRLTLPESSQQLSFGNAKNRHNLKWGIKKARDLGLEIRTADSETELRGWYGLYLEVMRRNSVPPRPYRFFAALWNELFCVGKLRLLLALHEEHVVAGSIFLMAKPTVFYAFTGCRDSALVSHANDLIVWTAIDLGCKEGFRYFDFGEVAEEHPELTRFKTKWGAEPVSMYRYYYHPVPVRRQDSESGTEGAIIGRVRKLWPHLPLRVTMVVGDLVNRFL